MGSNSLLYSVGLVLVILYLLMGIDDFIWDIVTLTMRKFYKKQKLDMSQLTTVPPKLLAVAIAAWHEDNVLNDVITNIIESTDYPKSMYHIFLGVYPNDTPTVRVAEALAKKFDNVHVIINELPGPTSKAQNINYVIRQMKAFEVERGWQFSALTVHDSEDVVHPFELRVTNYLLEEHEALQFPVFPIMNMPKFSNYFKNITTGTYADEFAENHFSTMVSRYASKAFVPSAGTGFSLSRKTLDSFGDEDVLPKDSLTEDYRLSLTLYQRGIRMYYVLEQVPRVNKHGKLIWDFVSTRSIFPDNFKAAVRQKTRWILGITMQSFTFKDIFKIKGIPFSGRYSLYKDLKAKIGNLLVMVGYPVLIYFGVSLFVPLDPIYPKGSLSWYLSLVVTLMMLERQLFRGVAIYNVYGMKSVFFACLLPPILPLRLIWGNIINMTATFRAYKQNWFGTSSKEKKQLNFIRKKQKVAWAKTDHVFLEKSVLKNYHRNLGDYLLQKGHITSEQLKEGLSAATSKGQILGNYFLESQIISEHALLESLADLKNIPFIQPGHLEDYELCQHGSIFKEEDLRNLKVLPLMKVPNGYVIAFCDESPNNAQTILRETYGIGVRAVFTSFSEIEYGIRLTYSNCKAIPMIKSRIKGLANEGIINYEQAIIARNYYHLSEESEEQILSKMGLFTGTRLPVDDISAV